MPAASSPLPTAKKAFQRFVLSSGNGQVVTLAQNANAGYTTVVLNGGTNTAFIGTLYAPGASIAVAAVIALRSPARSS